MSEKDSIKVLVADDHPMFRRGVVEAISEAVSLAVVAEAAHGAEALAVLDKVAVDVAVLDVDMPGMDGLEVALKLSTRKPDVKVVILTMHKRERIFNAALDAGVSAYLLKDEAIAVIVEAIRRVARGEVYISPGMSEFVMRRGRRNQELRETATGFDLLTRAELQVLRLVAQNKSSKEIGVELGISPRTVGTHRTNIAAKLELTGKHPLLNFALANRSLILSLPD